MNRRKAIQAVAAFAASVVAPVTFGAVEGPETVAQLEAWFERTFVCCDGPPKAFFEGPDGRIVYQCYVVSSAAERNLVRFMHRVFLTKIARGDVVAGGTLYWRRRPLLYGIGGAQKLYMRLHIEGMGVIL